MHFRPIATLCAFAAAAIVALKYPRVGTWNVLLLPHRLPEA
jgi:hypothetical protein